MPVEFFWRILLRLITANSLPSFSREERHICLFMKFRGNLTCVCVCWQKKKKDRLTQFLRLALKYAPWKLVSNFWPWAFEGFCWYARILKNPYLWSNFANKQTWRLSFQTYFLQENINSLYSLVSHIAIFSWKRLIPLICQLSSCSLWLTMLQ